ncbi:hypothetical protein MMC31_007980, partial [Peltigera leucophlebia]|nr:hypothetical protein [Peltigera leucophlebia]
MDGQQNHSAEYDAALVEITQIIREQIRLIEDNQFANTEYQRRINQEITDFAGRWDVAIRVEVRPREVADQSSTPSSATVGRQRQRQISFLPYEAPESQRLSPTECHAFMASLPYIPEDSLGEDPLDKQCCICYYRFFKSRGRLEAEAIQNGSVPRPPLNQQPHEVPVSDMSELP